VSPSSGPLTKTTTIHQDSMLEVNEFLVLDFIRLHGRATRPEICRALDLAPSTVGRIVASLASEGAIVESREARGGPGRPPTVFTFNRQAGCVLAVDLGGTRCRGAIADLGGDILDRDSRPSHERGRPFEALLASVAALREMARLRELPVRALAVGVPATIDPETLLGFSGPAVGWTGFELVPRIAGEVDVPFTLENDVNLATLAQAWRGEARRMSDFATLSIGTGVGGGIVTGGRLLKGHHNAGGEFGAFVTERSALRNPPHYGGEFEAVASGPALVRRAEQLLAGSDGAAGRASSPLADVEITPELIFDAAARGDPLASRVIEELVEHTAAAMIGIAAVVDPEAIILDGGVGRSMGAHLERIGELMTGRLPVVPRLIISTLGPDSTLIGAIAAAVQLARAHAAPGALFGTFSVAGEVPRHGGH